MHKTLLYVVACTILFVIAQDAAAHSTKDLKRIILNSETLVTDQVAFYLEPYVNRRVDAEGRRHRFAIWEFKDIVLEGDLAKVHVLVYDQKMTSKTPEVLYLQRNPDQTWNHVTEAGNVIQERIHTYVNPDGSISGGGHRQAADPFMTYAMAGGALALGGIVLAAMRRRRKAKGA